MSADINFVSDACFAFRFAFLTTGVHSARFVVRKNWEVAQFTQLSACGGIKRYLMKLF